MSEVQEVTGTQPLAEHKWLENLIGEWTYESEFWMEPGQEPQKSTGTESVRSLGGLWAVAENKGVMPGGVEMTSIFALGFDVTFKEYRGCWLASASSHLWKYVGTLSADGKTMSLDCEGPSMVHDGQTAEYRDVIELIDENTRVHKSYGAEKGQEMHHFMTITYRRV